MDQKVLTNIRVIEQNGPVGQKELLEKMGKVAQDAGWAKEGYIEALLTREAKYATGLHANGMDVAIPHADPEWTNEPAMVVGFLEDPVPFEPMGGVGDVVMAKIVIMLVIPDADTHIEFLSAFSTFIEEKSRLDRLVDSRDIEWFVSCLKMTMAEN